MKRALETHMKEHKAAIQEDNYRIVLLIIGTIAEYQSVYFQIATELMTATSKGRSFHNVGVWAKKEML